MHELDQELVYNQMVDVLGARGHINLGSEYLLVFFSFQNIVGLSPKAFLGLNGVCWVSPNQIK